MLKDIGQRELSSLIGDNIDDILVKVISFTHLYHQVLMDNIRNCRNAGFIPMHIDVESFARVLSAAVLSHQSGGKMVFSDAAGINFGSDGRLNITPEPDWSAHRLFAEDFAGYISLQKKRMSENIANNRAACGLLCHKLKLTDDLLQQPEGLSD